MNSCSDTADRKSVQPVLGYGGGCGSLLSPCTHTLVSGTTSRKAEVMWGVSLVEARLCTAACALHRGASDPQHPHSASSWAHRNFPV